MSRPARLNLSIDMSTTHDLGRFTRPNSSPVEPAPLRGLPSGRVGDVVRVLRRRALGWADSCGCDGMQDVGRCCRGGFTPLCFVHGLVV
jgi:hypothetical protein